MYRKYGIAATALCLLFAASSFAQKTRVINPKNRISTVDQAFLREVSRDNLAEIKTAKMVEQKTNDPAIREYARDLVSDHTKAEQQLSTVATSLGVTLPRQPNLKQTAAYDHLKSLSGRQLDIAFVKDNLQDHKNDIRRFDARLATSLNPALKNFVAMQLPHLQDHIRIAEDLAGNMNMPGRAGLNTPAEGVSAQALAQGSQNLNAKNLAPRPRPY